MAPCGSGVTGLSQGLLGGHRAPGAEVSCLVVEGTSRARAVNKIAFRPGHTAGGGSRLSPRGAPVALPPPSWSTLPAVTHPTGPAGHLGHAP